MPTFQGIANASAAVALDEHRLVVADDERKYLSLYSLDGGEALDLWKFKDRFSRHVDKEPDLEGATLIGDTIFWISSHGTDGAGRTAPDRAMLFATRVRDRPGKLDLEVQGDVYRDLLNDMEAVPTLNVVFGFPWVRDIPPKQPGGISIEGLATTPEHGLMIGFRNPLVGDMAVVVEVRNPFDLINGMRPDFAPPIFLDLGKRGIRSMEQIDRGYLIVAGPFGDDHQPRSALFFWNGMHDALPVELSVDLPYDFNPEAVFVVPNTDTICLLSDDGRFYRGEDRLSGPLEFRGLVFNLGTLLASL